MDDFISHYYYYYYYYYYILTIITESTTDYYCYHLHLCTSLHLWTLLFCIYGLGYYCCCCTVCTALLFSYSAIFI